MDWFEIWISRVFGALFVIWFFVWVFLVSAMVYVAYEILFTNALDRWFG